jgi:alpha-glucosidase
MVVSEKSQESLVFAANPDWWRGAVLYQIYPRSYFDADGNGVGDLRGIAAKLDYIKALGVDAVWISPFYKSPMKDFGYDVSDYKDVDPIFGTLDDFKTLLREAHVRKLGVLIDLVLSHTSDKHPWFQESRNDRTNPRADWYVWADPKPDGSPPNNWLSIFGGSGWEWDVRRRQYYLHNFLTSQPDLNFHNPAVQDAVLDVVKFWLDLGVDGFRLDTANFYFHDKELRPNPAMPAGSIDYATAANPYELQEHIYDKTRSDNLAFLERFRALLDRYPGSTSVGELGVETNQAQVTADYTVGGKRLHMAYNFQLLRQKHSPAYIRAVVSGMNTSIGSGWACWALSNHDTPRPVSRWGLEDVAEQVVPTLIALNGSLRGTVCIYEGEELGLTEAEIPFEAIQDPPGITFYPDVKTRDGCRTPMPWVKDLPHAGFSTVKPWLPVPADHAERAVDVQEAAPGSILNRVRSFLAWRKDQPALIGGSIRFLDAPETVVAFVREAEGQRILALFNLGRADAVFETGALGGIVPLGGHGFTASFEAGRIVVPALGAAFAEVLATA